MTNRKILLSKAYLNKYVFLFQINFYNLLINKISVLKLKTLNILTKTYPLLFDETNLALISKHQQPSGYMVMNSALTAAPPLTPKLKRTAGRRAQDPPGNDDKNILMNKAACSNDRKSSSTAVLNHEQNINHALMSAPCPCNNPVANYENLIINNSTLTNKFVGPYKDYDVPRTPIQQVIFYGVRNCIR